MNKDERKETDNGTNKMTFIKGVKKVGRWNFS